MSEQVEKMIIKVSNVAETNWILEGTEKNNPVRMAWPGLYRIIPTSKMKDPKGGPGYVNIRHIAGCDSIHPKEQDAEGFVPSIEADNIWIVNGNLSIARAGSFIGTYDYIKNYQGNGSNPNRPPDAEIEYVELKEGEIIKGKVREYDKMQEVMDILKSFRTRDENTGEFVYNTELINKIAPVFNLHLRETIDEKFVELSNIGMEDPDRLIQGVANPKKEIIALVKMAEKLSELVFTEDKVAFKDGTVVMVCKTKMTRATQVKKLVDALLTADGKVFLDQLRILTEKAAESSLSPVN
jgi:hypothetical protein